MESREQLYKEAGFYMPAFFHLQINSNISIKFVNLKDENEKQEEIKNFKSKLDLKQEMDEVLVVNIENNWTIAGFNDKLEFREISLANDSPLVEELLKKSSEQDKKKIVILAIAEIGYTQKLYKILESLQKLDEPPHIDESTFFHEYIHFLQDIFSTIGLINISNTINGLKGISDYSLKKKNVKVPIKLSKNILNYEVNERLFGIYLGDSNSPRYDNMRIKEVKVETKKPIYKGQTYTEEKVVLKLHSPLTSYSSSYNFGAMAIMESMCYLLEADIYNVSGLPQFPYESAQLLAKHIFPSIKNEYLLLLMEVSLLTYNPGLFFYNVLNSLKKKEYVITDSAQFRIYLMNYVTASDPFTNEKLNLISLLDREKERAKKEIDSIFTDPTLKTVSGWINNKIDHMYNLYKNGQFSFLNFYNQNKIESRKYFLEILKEFGAPIILNSEGYGLSIEGKIDQSIDSINVELFLAIYEIYQLFTSPKRKCGMINFCSNLESKGLVNYKVDKRCEKKPWERVNDKDLCPYAKMWKVWSFKNLTIL